MITEIFMSPRLIGARFEGPAIPLGVLNDLAVLEEMVVEVAKWKFLQQNPNRKRSPRGFTDGVELKLTAVEDGSAKPIISLFLAASDMLLPVADPKEYLEQARDAIVGAVGAAEDNSSITAYLPESALGYFDRLGRSLREGEAIEFTSPGRKSPARLTKETRRKLILASTTVQELTEATSVRGSIPEVDQDRMTFELQLIDGSKVRSPMVSQHLDTIIEAFKGYRKGTRVLLQGIGRFNRNQRLQGFESIEHINILDAQDIGCRLEELRGLRDGWLDGKGKALKGQGLDWLTQTLEQFPEDLPLPFLYPTAEGGVQAEWSVARREISLEIDLESLSAAWHCLNLADGSEYARNLDMNSDADLAWAIEQLRELAGAAA